MRPLWGKFLFILPHPSSRTTLCEAIWGGVSVHAATPLIEDPGLPDVQSGLKGSGGAGGGGGTGLLPQGQDCFHTILALMSSACSTRKGAS